MLLSGFVGRGAAAATIRIYPEPSLGTWVDVPEADIVRVPDLIRSLLEDPPRLAEMSAAMTRLARPNAADEIAEELIALAA